MMDYVSRKSGISWLKMWMLLLLMNSICVKSHEGGRNGDQKDGGGIM
jgi:hypothetical protein